MRKTGCCGLLILLVAGPTHAAAGDVTIGRYSVISATPATDQRDPLETVVRVTFPPYVRDVGGAIDYLLVRSGYRLADPIAAGEGQAILLRRTLPETQRRLGPMPLRSALKTLAGEAYWLVEDPVHRLVAFEVTDGYRQFLPPRPALLPNDQGAGLPPSSPPADTTAPVETTPLSTSDAEPVPPSPSLQPTNPVVQSESSPAESPTTPAQYGPTKRGDSLGSVTEALLPNPDYTINQRMLAVFERNPTAFRRLRGISNMNLLREGEYLIAPDAHQLGRHSREQALREVICQYQLWQNPTLQGEAK